MRVIKLTAFVEAVTGLALVVMPGTVVRALLGAELSGVGFPLSRVAGFGLLSLGVACLHSSRLGMLTYNVSVALYLLLLGFQGEWVGPLLWPAALLHLFFSLRLLSRSRG